MKTGVTEAFCIILNAAVEAPQLKRMYPVVPTVGIVLLSATRVWQFGWRTTGGLGLVIAGKVWVNSWTAKTPAIAASISVAPRIAYFIFGKRILLGAGRISEY